MNQHWIYKYLNKKWTIDYDCFAHFVEVQEKEFGITTFNSFQNLPQVLDYGAAIDYAKKDNSIREFWEEVKGPTKEGDAFIFGSGIFKFHIGTYVNIDGGGVLHCEHNRGVSFTANKEFKQVGMKSELIMRHKDS